MNPNSNHIEERELEENVAKGSIKESIMDLVKWADTLNEKKYKGKIIVKAYNCMTLDFYWRVDDELWVGPYWYGYQSGDTITYKFSSHGQGFKQFTEYFDRIWNNNQLMEILTQVTGIKETKSKKRR